MSDRIRDNLYSALRLYTASDPDFSDEGIDLDYDDLFAEGLLERARDNPDEGYSTYITKKGRVFAHAALKEYVDLVDAGHAAHRAHPDRRTDDVEEGNDIQRAADVALEAVDVVLKQKDLVLDRALVAVRVKNPPEGIADSGFGFTLAMEEEPTPAEQSYAMTQMLERLLRAVRRTG